MKRILLIIILPLILLTSIFLGYAYISQDTNAKKIRYFIENKLRYYVSLKEVKVPDDYARVDRNNNGVYDPIDIVNSARKEVLNKTSYKSVYYNGGYPPEGEGVCTDVIWRALEGIGVDLKNLVDSDIKENTSVYKRVNGKPDPNIDFRRVKNLKVYLERFAQKETTEIIPGNIENLRQWQPGDIIVINDTHIGIISDKRGRDGVPYIIHNIYPNAVESSDFDVVWKGQISGHYRWKY